MSMRILVTNDDGIMAPGLKVAEEIALSIAKEVKQFWMNVEKVYELG